MTRFTPIRAFLVASLVALAVPFVLTSDARAEAYAGAMIGLGLPMGTEADLDGATVYGATLGARVLPLFSIAATYLHDGFETSGPLAIDYDVDQFLAEANFFSLFFMNAGLHAGAVSTEVLGTSTTDLGFGAHVGFDFHLTEQFSVGGAGYWTWVTADDKYATLNLMVPVKVWF